MCSCLRAHSPKALGPTIQWGLLNYPALRSNIHVYKAKRDEQVLTYQKTVLTAFQDVEDALVAYDKEQGRQKIGRPKLPNTSKRQLWPW